MHPGGPPQPLITAEAIGRRNAELASDIVRVFGREFVMVVLLKGAFVFAADLLRALGQAGAQPRVEFLQLSSYGTATESSGDIRRLSEMPTVAGERVLVVDDVLDTGRSLAYAAEALTRAGAKAVRLCVLLDKPARRVVDLAADHVGFTIPDRFVVGYGIDCAERWRELRDVAAVD